MMRIESGSTGERKIRTGLFVVMCLAFAGWFAYDGFVGYPSANLEWALSAMPEKPEHPTTTPQASVATLTTVQPGMSEAELRGLLGEPALEQWPRWVFQGEKVTGIVHLKDDQVARVEIIPVTAAPKTINYVVTEEALKKIAPGSSSSDVTGALGQPADRLPRTLWYVGPAAYGRFEIAAGKVAGKPEVVPSTQKEESSIMVQKVLAGILAVIGLAMLGLLATVLLGRLVLDGTGLRKGRRFVSWDQMRALRGDDYREKGWVTLVYDDSGQEKTMRLDSYHIDRFRDVIEAICERKQLDSPLPPRNGSAAEAES